MKLAKLIDTKYTITGEITGKNGTRPWNTFGTLEEAEKTAKNCTFNVFVIRKIDVYKTVFGKINITKTIMERI